MKAAFLLLLALAFPAAAQPFKPWDGGPTPALELPDAKGGSHRLEDYRGKAVLVNFWATWCTPCREEMPSMEKLREALRDEPFVVLAVNVGEGARAARNFGEKLGLGFPLLLDQDTRATRAWGARVLPASFIVAPDGTIRYAYFGAIDWAREDVRAAILALVR